MAKVNITREPDESEADFRRRYHRAWEDQNRRERGVPVKKIPKVPCPVSGCDRLSEIKGLCGKHYRAQRVERLKAQGKNPSGRTRGHPFYSIWFERKSRNSLCIEWAADFWAFQAAVGDRPSPTHLLRRFTTKRPYSPENWYWLDALKRKEGEADADFHARKWASRKARFPDFEVGRHLLREFGLMPHEYRAMLEAQSFVCQICKSPETAKRAKSDAPKALAVDHCHATGKIRGLLCWGCNSILGKVKDNPETLRAMAAYLEHHAAP